jgi:hypothetical protein
MNRIERRKREFRAKIREWPDANNADANWMLRRIRSLERDLRVVTRDRNKLRSIVRKLQKRTGHAW